MAYVLYYVGDGAKTLQKLALLSIFKNKYGLQPAAQEELDSLILLPASFKLVYGLISDTIPIKGSNRKNYLILMNLM